MLDPPEDFFRLAPGREVRLRFGYAINCDEVVYNEDGSIKELLCRYDPETAKGKTPDGRKIKGIIHWVSARHAVDAEVRVYDRLFNHPTPGNAENFEDVLNPDSLQVFANAKLEPSLADAQLLDRFQFERLGYFCLDSRDNMSQGKPVFNRTVSLRDTWAKLNAKH